MRAMMLATAASLASGGAYISGAVGSGEYYAMPPAQVAEKLADMPLPDKLTGGDADGQLQLVRLAATDRKISWELLLGGDKLADVDADLASTWMGGTRVSIDFRPAPEGEINQKIASSLPLDSDFVDDVIEMAIGEQADAYLEDRPFDQDKLRIAVTGYAAMHPDKVKAYADRMRTLAAEHSESSDWDRSERSYATDREVDPSYGKAAPARGTPARPERDSSWDESSY